MFISRASVSQLALSAAVEVSLFARLTLAGVRHVLLAVCFRRLVRAALSKIAVVGESRFATVEVWRCVDDRCACAVRSGVAFLNFVCFRSVRVAGLQVSFVRRVCCVAVCFVASKIQVLGSKDSQTQVFACVLIQAKPANSSIAVHKYQHHALLQALPKQSCAIVATLQSLVDAGGLSATEAQFATLQTAPANNRTLWPLHRFPAKIETAAG